MINPFTLQERRYLITGAASGIGKATAEILSGMGADLILVDINERGLEETAKQCPATTTTLRIDLSDTGSLTPAIEAVVKEKGKLNGIVHVAGLPCISPLKALSIEKLNTVFSVNTYAAAIIAKIFSNKKIYAGENGSIVFVSSVYASVGSPCNAGYAMSKAAIEGLTRALSMELAGRKIRVNCVAPGFIKTPMDTVVSAYFDEAHENVISGLHPLGLGEPCDIAYAIVYLLSDASKWVTGSILHVDGGFTAQ